MEHKISSEHLLALAMVSHCIHFIAMSGVIGEENARDTLKSLEEMGYVQGPPTAKSDRKWKLTEKGAVFILMVLATPEPVTKWIDPRS